MEPVLMPPASDPLQIGEWLVDPRDDSLTRGSERVKLEPRTMRLLVRLAQAPGTVVSLDELLESVWTGVVVGTASVYQSMSQLRKVLGDTDDPPRYIETVARKGYRLVANVSQPPSVIAPPATEPAAPDAEVRRAPRRRWIALAAAAGLAVMAAAWMFWPRGTASAQPASVVVLPFLDLSESKSEQAFCDGLTEETSNWLAQIPTLRVVARTSAFAYRDRVADVRTIGRELETTHIVEGSLRRSGNHIRITVQLIDTRTGYHLWSDSYNVEAGDVLAMQEDIARKVADNLEIRITAETDSRFAGRRSKSDEAQRLFLIAKAHAQKSSNESNERAIVLYRQALEADPEFALAKVWLAHAIVGRRFYNSQPIETLAPEVEPLLADVARDAPDLVDLYVVRGYFYTEMRKREPAMRDLRHALELNPNSFAAATKLGFYYLTAGEPREALTYYTMAAALNPTASDMHGSRCMALTELGQFTAAAAACERARALGPESPWVYAVSGSLEQARGDLEAAFQWNDMALEKGSDMATIQGERAGWLVTLGMLKDAGTLYQRVLATSPDTARRNSSLMYAGTLAAIDAEGSQGLRRFIRDNGLEGAREPTQLMQLANAALIAGDDALANQFISGALASPMLSAEDLASPWQASAGYSDLLVIAAARRAEGDDTNAGRRLDELAALLDRMTNAGVQTYGLYFVRAQLEAMRGQADKAMSSLQQAVQLGWRDAWIAERLPSLESLRDRGDFRELIAAVNARNTATAAKLRSKLLG